MKIKLFNHYLHLTEQQQNGSTHRCDPRFAERPNFTPDPVSSLKPDEVFVFGSDLKGLHRGGAANFAHNHFGAKLGLGRGPSGQSYAIPTARIPLDEIRVYVDEFLQYARSHKDQFFYVSRIGCGNAGYTIDQIAPLFAKAAELGNLCLPVEFEAYLNLSLDPSLGTRAPKAVRMQNYGQVRTLADLSMVLNAQKHYTSPHALIDDLENLLVLYRQRGTVTDDSICSFKLMLKQNAAKWFTDGHFDTDKMYAHLQNEADNDAMDAFELIHERRAKAKIARVMMLMNQIARYTDPLSLMTDVNEALLEEGKTPDSCHAIDWDDSYHYPYIFFMRGIRILWDYLIDSEGHLDNDKFNQVMFANHEKKVEELGISEVIRQDYTPDGICHPEVLVPNEFATGPIYVKIGTDQYVKSCGEGKGPNRYPERFEMQFLIPVLERLCQGEDPEYFFFAGFYIPMRDFSRPVYWRYGMRRFKTDKDKKLFMMQKLKDYKAAQEEYE